MGYTTLRQIIYILTMEGIGIVKMNSLNQLLN